MKQPLFLTVFVFLLIPLAGTAQQQNPVVAMETNYGIIKIELFADKAPATVRNFLAYVDAKHYDGTIFHRAFEDFIQGGGFTSDMKKKQTKDPIQNESSNGLANKRGTIGMARGAKPHSATAQYYINAKDNPLLDKFKCCVFGRVIEGMEVIDIIKNLETNDRQQPIQPVIIKSMRRSM